MGNGSLAMLRPIGFMPVRVMFVAVSQRLHSLREVPLRTGESKDG